VTWKHLLAFVWLRWRLMINQWRRAGALNAVLMMIVAFGALAMAVPLFIGCFALGLFVIPKATPAQLLYAWDGLLAAFLFFWALGLVTELRRTDPMTLSKFMHLPVSVHGAFVINYVSSLFRLSLITLGPVMLAFALALVVAKGISLLPALPLLAAFLLMVTALTYQLQGWLASLMSNPRRRRTVIVVATAIFILVVQAPNLLNFFAPWGRPERASRNAGWIEELKELDRSLGSQEFDSHELARRKHEITQRHQLAIKRTSRESAERWEHTVRLVNLLLPVGWLPLGVMTAAEGHVLPSILGLLGMTLIGVASLWRAYRTTIGLYRGQFTNRRGRPAPAVAQAPHARKSPGLLLEARLPGLSEPVSAIALGGFRSLARSPEAKMMLLSPMIMIPIFGSMLWKTRQSIPESLRPLVAIGGMVLVLLGLLQLMGNQFGFDRDGFRVFVLSAARRRDVLLGKNLAFAPVALGIALALLAIVQITCPMRMDHVLAMVPLYVSMFLLFCISTNLLSIFAPVHVAAGSLNPSNPKLTTVLLQLVMIFFLVPLTQGPTLLPLAIEGLCRQLGWPPTAPICLVLSLAECAAVVVFYRFALEWQGDLFQAREQRILEAVTDRAD
jgi:hypothetical protein